MAKLLPINNTLLVFQSIPPTPPYSFVNLSSSSDPPSQYAASGQWTTGLCDCTSDVSSCCCTILFSCIVFGRIAEIVDKGATTCCASGVLYLVLSFTGWECLYSCMYRSKLRQEYMLPAQPCGDCLVHCFCKPCALCQEYRELKYRGLDTALGWQGNLRMQNHGVVMPPFGPGEMKR